VLEHTVGIQFSEAGKSLLKGPGQRALWRCLPMRAAPALALVIFMVMPAPCGAKVPVATACRAEADKYCKEALKAKEKGAELVLQCLEEMSPVLVEPCRRFVQAMVACRTESKRFCKGRVSDEGWACLLRRRGQLSGPCRAAIEPPPPEDPLDIGPCGADYDRFCWKVRPGDGRQWRCLREHWDELEDECRAYVEGK